MVLVWEVKREGDQEAMRYFYIADFDFFLVLEGMSESGSHKPAAPARVSLSYFFFSVRQGSIALVGNLSKRRTLR